MKPPTVYDQYFRNPNAEGTTCPEHTLTRASEAAACDINNIMRRFEKTGILPEGKAPPYFGDVSQIGDYRTMQHQMIAAQNLFDQLPLETRQLFDHSVAALLDFVADPANKSYAQELQLLPPDAAPEPAPTPIEPPTASPEPSSSKPKGT